MCLNLLLNLIGRFLVGVLTRVEARILSFQGSCEVEVLKVGVNLSLPYMGEFVRSEGFSSRRLSRVMVWVKDDKPPLRIGAYLHQPIGGGIVRVGVGTCYADHPFRHPHLCL